ncbi:hypothetical protein [Phycisphaera mikurensis]|uniref:Acetolactate decarboxylase n=1 Tax=Phycisphaera mikurensis (strain NBRC 102666 / KCTC 22515 / FYK2301M01) TaxID=1142394 RepID=I0IH99_PHYMF|nr:hypothetical protein [Phycisphaera mikurensis]MBB6440886.1 hypothetical protein [Phycisphaera mikurensis]BAM04637.1 hypothetical protein PSMK_24780 [Phycisphaera mikurensis NBRC 102666]
MWKRTRTIASALALAAAAAGPAAALEAIGSRLEALRDPGVAHAQPAGVDADGARAWALGPVAGFRGEVTTWNGVPHVCVLDAEGRPFTLPPDEGGRRPVGFLVRAMAAPSDWPSPHREAGRTRDLAGLARLVEAAADASGVDLDAEGVAFRLEGRAEEVTYHVIWRPDGERPLAEGEHPGVLHRERKIRFTRKDVPVRLVGVYARPLEGTHTHPGNPLHVHAILPHADHPGSFVPVRTVGGHVEAILLGGIDAFSVTTGR